jgi:hypothetical protein
VVECTQETGQLQTPGSMQSVTYPLALERRAKHLAPPHPKGPTYKDDILLFILILLLYAVGGKGRGAEPMPGGAETAKPSLNDNANRALRPTSEVYKEL